MRGKGKLFYVFLMTNGQGFEFIVVKNFLLIISVRYLKKQ